MKLKARLLPLTGLALALGSWTQDAAQDPAERTADVLMEADRAFSADTEERALEGWLAWFADDATVVRQNGEPVRGATELRAYYRSLPGFPPAGFRWEPKSAGLAKSSDLGWTAGTYSVGDQ